MQFTPDLLPTDLVGVSVWRKGTETFEFQKGPLFANIVLADEINRASPKTQSALLEAMEERQVTADGVTRSLGKPFLVIATQNPVEQEGTYRLPESQLDRFLLRLSLGYPDRAAELAILEPGTGSSALDTLSPVVTGDDIVRMAAATERVHMAPALLGYIVDIAHASRRHPGISLGLSPRATVQLARGRPCARCGPGPRFRHSRRREGAGRPRAGSPPVVASRRRRPRTDARVGDRRVGRGGSRAVGPVGPVPSRQGWAVLAAAAAASRRGPAVRRRRAVHPRRRPVRPGPRAVLRAAVQRCGLEVDRVVDPARPEVGDDARVQLHLRATGASPAVDLWEPVAGVGGAALRVAPLRRGERATATYRLPTARRGLVQVGPLSGEMRDAFGLARRSTWLASAREVLVFPTAVEVPLPHLGSGTGALSRHLARRAIGHASADEFRSLRDYVPGDDLRRVNWRASARRDDLVVRETDPAASLHLTAVFDLHANLYDPESFERAVSVVASLAVSGRPVRPPLRLVTTDSEEHLVDAVHLDEVLTHLATVSAVRRTDPAAGPVHERGSAPRRRGHRPDRPGAARRSAGRRRDDRRRRRRDVCRRCRRAAERVVRRPPHEPRRVRHRLG